MHYIKNLVYHLPHELSNSLKLRVLGNQEILGKGQDKIKLEPSVKSSFQKRNLIAVKIYTVVNAVIKVSCSSHISSHVLPKIVCINKFLFIDRPILLQTSMFWSSDKFKAFLNFVGPGTHNLKQNPKVGPQGGTLRTKQIILLFPEIRMTKKIFTRAAAKHFFINLIEFVKISLHFFEGKKNVNSYE